MKSFAERVYALCEQVPFGSLSTYKLIAEALGTRAYRAVGQALNKNPRAPIVPCHRIISSAGHLQGFAQGLKVKRTLLENEGIPVKNFKVIDFEKYLYRFKR